MSAAIALLLVLYVINMYLYLPYLPAKRSPRSHEARTERYWAWPGPGSLGVTTVRSGREVIEFLNELRGAGPIRACRTGNVNERPLSVFLCVTDQSPLGLTLSTVALEALEQLERRFPGIPFTVHMVKATGELGPALYGIACRDGDGRPVYVELTN